MRFLKNTLCGALAAAALTVASASASAGLMITQFYEGSSFNKWIELKNTSSTTVDLSDYSLSLWSNANTENYKTGGSPNNSASLSGELAAGGVFLLSHTSAALPSYATADVKNGSVLNFNGDDSVVLSLGNYSGVGSIVDAIGFTDSGNEGSNTSFVRISTDAGWNTIAGSDVLDFASVWQEVSTADVDNAAAGTDERLGFAAVPEPSSIALAGLGLAGALAMGIRRRGA